MLKSPTKYKDCIGYGSKLLEMLRISAMFLLYYEIVKLEVKPIVFCTYNDLQFQSICIGQVLIPKLH